MRTQRRGAVLTRGKVIHVICYAVQCDKTRTCSALIKVTFSNNSSKHGSSLINAWSGTEL